MFKAKNVIASRGERLISVIVNRGPGVLMGVYDWNHHQRL